MTQIVCQRVSESRANRLQQLTETSSVDVTELVDVDVEVYSHSGTV